MVINRLEEYFSSADDLLFDLASKSSNNNDQNQYFEALRELRLKKAPVIESFSNVLFDEFQNTINGSPPDITNLLPESQQFCEDFELLEEESLEISVAVQTMAQKARNNNQEQLHQLCYRFDYMLNQRVTADNNPLDPLYLANQFSQCSQVIDLNIKARVLILKQFETIVLSQLGSIYQNANQLLIDSGILPSIKNTVRQQTATQLPPADSAVAQQFQELQQALENIRGANQETSQLLSLGNYASAPPIDKIQLIQLLSAIQSHTQGTQYDANSPSDSKPGNTLPNIVHSIFRQQHQQGEPASLASADEDTINLVSMFFDFVLDDEALPVDMQALLSRLQIPVLKIALKDGSFFTNNNHPVRELINELGAASYDRKPDANQDKAFYQLANGIIQSLVDEVHSELHEFSNPLNELRAYLNDERQKAVAIEKRSSESAHAKSLTRHVRSKVHIALTDKFVSLSIPVPIADFLFKDWLYVLFFSNLKHGDDSKEWLSVVQLADDLLWSGQLHQDERSNQRLRKILPELYKRIELGFNNYQPANTTWPQRLKQIKQIHLLIIKQEFEHYRHTLRAYDESGVPVKVSSQPTQNTSVENLPIEKRADYIYVEAIKKLKTGDWLRFALGKSNTQRYCRVSTYIDTDETYLLVNRFGVIAAQVCRHKLAKLLQNKQLIILEGTPLFDLAISNISQRLNSITGSSE